MSYDSSASLKSQKLSLVHETEGSVRKSIDLGEKLKKRANQIQSLNNSRSRDALNIVSAINRPKFNGEYLKVNRRRSRGIKNKKKYKSSMEGSFSIFSREITQQSLVKRSLPSTDNPRVPIRDPESYLNFMGKSLFIQTKSKV